MYEVAFSDRALKSLKKINKPDAQRIVSAIDELATNPDGKANVKRLVNHPDALYRLRVGDYRVLFDRHDEIRVIAVIDAGHCKDIYL